MGSERVDFDWPESPLMEIVSRVREPQLPVLVIAHRGDSQNAPENTLAAFSLALENQADLMELDVWLTGDGDVVVIHDEKVDRTSDGHGLVHEQSTEALRELSFGSWFSPAFEAERIPLLDELLDLCRGRAVPMIEIKVRHKYAPDASSKIVEALRRHGMEDKAIVICRELIRVKEIRDASPLTPMCYMTFTKRQARAATRIPQVCGVNPYWRSLSLRLVAELRGKSFFLTPWTVNRARDMERLFLLGCEAIITDCPVTLRDQIEAFQFQRAIEVQERFLRGEPEADLDLESVEDLEGESPEEAARMWSSDSETAIEFLPEDLDEEIDFQSEP